MSLYVLDTDIFSLAQHGHTHVSQRIVSKFAEVAISAITVQEQMDGWRGRIQKTANQPSQLEAAYQSLVQVLLPSWTTFPVLPFTTPAIHRFDYLLTLRLNVGRMDLRIAAIALEAGATVVTRNQRDFGRIPGLSIVDWSV